LCAIYASPPLSTGIKISQEKAAIAGLNRRIEALAREQVDVFVVDFDDLRFLQPNNAAQFQPHDRFWSNCALWYVFV